MLAILGADSTTLKPPDLEVRIRRVLATTAIAAGQRDEDGALDPEDLERHTERQRAGSLALIGLCILNSGMAEGDEVIVGLPPESIGDALSADDDLP